ncbi:hypothetical protein SAMN05216588_115103 [Pseudomonas flavescens]|uniref:Uncharacterized protein n=1 Tax=Phytopseudomonas flavescens TaxID=29435 RepID=A0A1G8JYM8_9GAMM|nr:hypothetical protein SAMN05216588_115103 [Pseudomonas flavescens]
MSDGNEAVCSQPGERVAQPDREPLTLLERRLIRFYRDLDERQQAFVREAVESLALLKKRE